MHNLFSLLWTDVLEIGCSIKFPLQAYSVLATSRGAPIVRDSVETVNK
jgi:hypothetical protein